MIEGARDEPGAAADLLIVEDDEEIAALMELILTEEGHRVRVARDGEQGLAALSEALPELILLDAEMPLLDGPGMADRMFVHNLGMENIPVVIVSAASQLSAIAARVGTPYFLPKPFYPDDLLSLTARALRERQVPRPGLATSR